jgi:D-alanine-D-alanine ligase-like ATP-grasp enzyme
MAMDKDIAKRLFQEAGIPTAKVAHAPATVQELKRASAGRS